MKGLIVLISIISSLKLYSSETVVMPIESMMSMSIDNFVEETKKYSTCWIEYDPYEINSNNVYVVCEGK